MEHVVYGFVTAPTLDRIGAPSTLDELQIVVRDTSLDRDAVRRVAAEARKVLEQSGYKVLAVNVPVPMQHVHAAQMDSMMFTQGAFALLTLLACAALVVNLVSAMLATQVREIGVMKAIGAQPTQLARMYLTSIAALGVLSTGLALPIAIFIGPPLCGAARRHAELPGGWVRDSSMGDRDPGLLRESSCPWSRPRSASHAPAGCPWTKPFAIQESPLRRATTMCAGECTFRSSVAR